MIIDGQNNAAFDRPVPEVVSLLTETRRTFVVDDGPIGYRCVEEPVLLRGDR